MSVSVEERVAELSATRMGCVVRNGVGRDERWSVVLGNTSGVCCLLHLR